MPRNTTRVIPHQRNTISTPAQTSVGAAAGIVLAANALRTGLTIQNTGTTVIYLACGPTNPTVTAYHTSLAACSIANDGTGGFWSDDVWNGVVRAIGSGAGGSVVVSELLMED